MFERGEHIEPKKGPAIEVIGVLLELIDPRARLSRTETRGKLFSALGELCWYLSGSNVLKFVRYYVDRYIESADGDIIFGGYGPRLFGPDQQFRFVTEALKKHPVSRQGVIQIFSAADIRSPHNDVPCTCTLQALIRHEQLHLVAHMRSNDWFLGLPHDFFAFTMLQEIMARTLSLDLGAYKHMVGSFHLYDRDRAAAENYQKEGWQSTMSPMPPMPKGDPWPSIAVLLAAEEQIRLTGLVNDNFLRDVDPYWADLIRLLLAFRGYKDKNAAVIESARDSMSSTIFDPFIRKALDQIR